MTYQPWNHFFVLGGGDSPPNDREYVKIAEAKIPDDRHWTFARNDMGWYLIPLSLVDEFHRWVEHCHKEELAAVRDLDCPAWNGHNFDPYRSGDPCNYVFNEKPMPMA